MDNTVDKTLTTPTHTVAAIAPFAPEKPAKRNMVGA